MLGNRKIAPNFVNQNILPKQPPIQMTGLGEDSYIDREDADGFSSDELADVDEGVSNTHNEATLGMQPFSTDISEKPKGEKLAFESVPRPSQFK